MKTVIIGNSGSGKTWLARRLAVCSPAALIHLDEIFWMPGGFNEKRAPEEIAALIHESRLSANWIAEGVFGDLAAHYLEDAQMLIWLDFPWQVCEARLLQRGSESKKHMGRAQSEQGLQELLDWARNYPARQGMRSHQGHSALFSAFRGLKFRLEDEASVMKLVERVARRDGIRGSTVGAE